MSESTATVKYYRDSLDSLRETNEPYYLALYEWFTRLQQQPADQPLEAPQSERFVINGMDRRLVFGRATAFGILWENESPGEQNTGHVLEPEPFGIGSFEKLYATLDGPMTACFKELRANPEAYERGEFAPDLMVVMYGLSEFTADAIAYCVALGGILASLPRTELPLTDEQRDFLRERDVEVREPAAASDD
jgi:hypothetical protein